MKRRPAAPGSSALAGLQRSQQTEIEPAGINRHADDGVNGKRGELADFLQGGDAPGGGQLQRGGPAQAAEPVQVCALHKTLLVDESAQESGAERRGALDEFFGAEAGRLAP